MSQFLLFLIEVGTCLVASGVLVITLTSPLRRDAKSCQAQLRRPHRCA
jgi:hypothetical protein